jgi:hypothetical protein
MVAVSPYWLALPVAMAIAASSVAAATIVPSAQLQAPPPAFDETVPSPPLNCGTVTWLPGRWRGTGVAGAEWQWERGRYVQWPPDRTASVIGQRQSQPDDEVWIEDDWR